MAKRILNKTEIKTQYQSLLKGGITDARKRGFEFENLIFSLLHNENLEPRASYRPDGEQVDGSFFWQGQTFLLEAKWVKDPLPASSIYSFKGKLDGKFHTSSGVFIAVNGYSNDVEDALKFGKSLNILLFDENDIPMIFNGEVSFLEVLKFKLRQAGDTGSLKASYKLKEKAQTISNHSPEITDGERINQKIKNDTFSKQMFVVDDLLVFVEGKSDIPPIKKLIDTIKNHYSLSYRIQTLDGINNLRQLPTLISIYGDYKKTKAVIIVLDNDEEINAKQDIAKNITDQFQKAPHLAQVCLEKLSPIWRKCSQHNH